ncbi:AraC-like DNA-binding protein [Ereboglobus sp. PH5-10]|uniref:AraC family transcriptional regulator n=1 Tax=Ereboglobus sp. PH5-10 TaxID=2940629 RepID=UPI00240667D9|nr:AraC family transcriptional regulator [Ereboglobus sp. PH5-10]MDF9828530.1 AraC-like DNA-binding protein [Ereboglobus sp. PH5-10]
MLPPTPSPNEYPKNNHGGKFTKTGSPQPNEKFSCTRFRDIGIYYSFERAHHWPEYKCDQHQLILITNETAETELSWTPPNQPEQRQWLIGRHIVFIEANLPRSIHWERDGAFICLCVGESFLKRLALRDAWSGVHIKPCAELSKGDMLIWHLSSILEDLCDPNVPAEHPLYMEALGTMLTAHLLRMRKQEQARALLGPKLTALQLNRVYSYIDEHLRDSIHVESLARAAGISKDHFAKLFKYSTGVTPHRCILVRRLQHAEKLIKQGRLSIAEVAIESGFCDQSHLSRWFRRLREEHIA